jgi:hypothetical protein
MDEEGTKGCGWLAAHRPQSIQTVSAVAPLVYLAWRLSPGSSMWFRAPFSVSARWLKRERRRAGSAAMLQLWLSYSAAA